ncbi:hypothetical protein Hanom_Chr15g01398361 [Helianthus anomalus]
MSAIKNWIFYLGISKSLCSFETKGPFSSNISKSCSCWSLDFLLFSSLISGIIGSSSELFLSRFKLFSWIRVNSFSKTNGSFCGTGVDFC